ncbi:MAG: PilZ domain-containing protein [Candidatus Omnitrophota bacterium]|jgi:hypothetical protein
MIKKIGVEKRLHPRLDHSLPLKVAANGFDFKTATQNISCLGTYCRIDKYIPPFTRVAIKLSLPVAMSEGVKHLAIECNGVIVRVQDEPDGSGFNVAIFFNRIREDQRKKISQYVNQFLPKEAPAAVTWGR